MGAAYIDNVEGQADSEARAIGIRFWPWGVPRAARVIGAGEAAVDEGVKGREDEGPAGEVGIAVQQRDVGVVGDGAVVVEV